MIKPSNLDLSTPQAALASYEKSRFAGLDLEASTKEPVVLEEHEDYDLVQIELQATNGKPIFRKIKAYKNGETVEVPPEEVPEPPALASVAITGPATVKIGSKTQYTVALTPSEAVAKVTKWTTTAGTITNAGELTANKLGAGTVSVDVDGKKKTFNITVENKPTLTVTGNPTEADAPFSVTVGSNPADAVPTALTVSFDKVGLVAVTEGVTKVGFTFAEAYTGTDEIEVTISAPDFTAVKFKVLIDAGIAV